MIGEPCYLVLRLWKKNMQLGRLAKVTGVGSWGLLNPGILSKWAGRGNRMMRGKAVDFASRLETLERASATPMVPLHTASPTLAINVDPEGSGETQLGGVAAMWGDESTTVNPWGATVMVIGAMAIHLPNRLSCLFVNITCFAFSFS